MAADGVNKLDLIVNHGNYSLNDFSIKFLYRQKRDPSLQENLSLSLWRDTPLKTLQISVDLDKL